MVICCNFSVLDWFEGCSLRWISIFDIYMKYIKLCELGGFSV